VLLRGNINLSILYINRISLYITHFLLTGERTNVSMAEPLRILVVDDNEDLLKTLSHILKRNGFDVEMAADGCMAVDRYFHGDFNVTLMDIDMPRLNGVEAFRLIREMDPEASVILMTGRSDDDLIRLGH
jgi:CheY-like chemotaxis protein